MSRAEPNERGSQPTSANGLLPWSTRHRSSRTTAEIQVRCSRASEQRPEIAVSITSLCSLALFVCVLTLTGCNDALAQGSSLSGYVAAARARAQKGDAVAQTGLG